MELSMELSMLIKGTNKENMITVHTWKEQKELNEFIINEVINKDSIMSQFDKDDDQSLLLSIENSSETMNGAFLPLSMVDMKRIISFLRKEAESIDSPLTFSTEDSFNKRIIEEGILGFERAIAVSKRNPRLRVYYHAKW